MILPESFCPCINASLLLAVLLCLPIPWQNSFPVFIWSLHPPAQWHAFSLTKRRIACTKLLQKLRRLNIHHGMKKGILRMLPTDLKMPQKPMRQNMQITVPKLLFPTLSCGLNYDCRRIINPCAICLKFNLFPDRCKWKKRKYLGNCRNPLCCFFPQLFQNPCCVCLQRLLFFIHMK